MSPRRRLWRFLTRPASAYWPIWILAALLLLGSSVGTLIGSWRLLTFGQIVLSVVLIVGGIGCLLGGRIVWLRGRAAQRLRACRCLQCGYDLRGNAQGICPECGTISEIGRFRRTNFQR